MRNRIVLSCGPGKLHFYYAARVVQQMGELDAIIVPTYLRKKWTPFVERMASHGSKFWNRLLLTRDDEVDEARVRSMLSMQLLDRGIWFLKRRGISEKDRDRLEYIGSTFYSNIAVRHIKPPVKLIHSRSGFSRAIAPHARKIGAKVLLEQSIAHPRFIRKLMEEEYENWKVPEKFRTYGALLKEIEWDINQSDYIITNSDFCRDTIIKHERKSKKIYVVYWSVDTDEFRPVDRSVNKKFTVLLLGNISVRKGIGHLVSAWVKLNLPNARLIIVGRKMTDTPGIFDKHHDRFEYRSRIPHSMVPSMMHNADVFVLPSLAEGSARVIGEAMASGLTCIVTPNCGSVIQDGIDGFIVPIQNADALAERILHLYENRDLAVEMGLAARETALKSLTWRRYEEELASVYTELLEENT